MNVMAKITAQTVPTNEAELIECLGSWEWRMFSGALYQIMIKGKDGEENTVAPFMPNRAQRLFLKSMRHRNVILKARQLGFTTLIAILWLDHALFNANQRCGIIAHTREAAEEIFRDKVKFAYLRLPEVVRELFPLIRDSASELHFAHNNSAVRVSTSMRSGTYHRLHVSEMGKIAAQFPKKAREIVTGSLPAVPETGIAIIESTAEGREGDFYDIATRAEARCQLPTPLAAKEFQFHFFPWHVNPDYETDPTHITITEADHLYFSKIEVEMKTTLSLRQRAWYVSERENGFAGDAEVMWREFPSTPEECWRRSTEGIWYARQLARARVEGRIGHYPHIAHIPVNTFWDIGSGDGTAIWLHQYIGGQNRWIGFIEGWAEGYDYYVRNLRETQYVFGGMYLPHDATHERQLADSVGTPMSMLQKLAPDFRWKIVPRVTDLVHGIELTRMQFSTYCFNERTTKAGLERLAGYKKTWNSRHGAFSDVPVKLDGNSEAADAIRQHAQGFDPSHTTATTQRPKRRGYGSLGAI